MVKVDLPVVRVFTHLITVGWETRIGEGRGLAVRAAVALEWGWGDSPIVNRDITDADNRA